MTYKLIIFVLILMMSIVPIPVTAYNIQVINIENIQKEFKFEYTNLTYAQFKTLDASDKITKLVITLKDKDVNSGIMVNFSGNVTYTALTSKYLYLGFIPYKNVTHFMTYKNYTIFRESKNYNTIFAFDSTIDIEYNVNNGNTTFQFSPNANIIDILKYYTGGYTGLPTDSFVAKSLTKFDMVLEVKDINENLFIKSRKAALSVISQYIYGILTLNGVLGENDILLSLLSILDIFFTITVIVFALLFIYPNLIIIWIITIGNIYSAYHANTLKQFIIYLKAYYIFVGEKTTTLLNGLFNLILTLISTIRQLLQI